MEAMLAGIVTKLFSREKWVPDENVLVGADADAGGRLTVKKGGHAAWRVAGASLLTEAALEHWTTTYQNKLCLGHGSHGRVCNDE